MFFTSSGRQVSHVTIFLGENKFIHAPRTGRRISIETLNRYWRQKFVKGKKFPNMDYLENRYLVLPLHHKVTVSDAKHISSLVNKYVK